jgi:hypothetical protein
MEEIAREYVAAFLGQESGTGNTAAKPAIVKIDCLSD